MNHVEHRPQGGFCWAFFVRNVDFCWKAFRGCSHPAGRILGAGGGQLPPSGVFSSSVLLLPGSAARTVGTPSTSDVGASMIWGQPAPVHAHFIAERHFYPCVLWGEEMVKTLVPSHITDCFGGMGFGA